MSVFILIAVIFDLLLQSNLFDTTSILANLSTSALDTDVSSRGVNKGDIVLGVSKLIGLGAIGTLGLGAIVTLGFLDD